MYQSHVSSHGSDLSVTESPPVQQHNKSPRKSIFDRDSVKVVPKIEKTKSELGIKIGVTEQNNVVTKHANFVKLVYTLLFSSLVM